MARSLSSWMESSVGNVLVPKRRRRDSSRDGHEMGCIRLIFKTIHENDVIDGAFRGKFKVRKLLRFELHRRLSVPDFHVAF